MITAGTSGGIMIKQSKKIDSSRAMTAAKRSVAFWSSIDGAKLARVGFAEKDADVIGPEKPSAKARIAS
jgi:hypothetical protein